MSIGLCAVRNKAAVIHLPDCGLTCGRGYAPFTGDRSEFLPPRAIVCNNSRVMLIGMIVNREGVAWHKGDTVCLLKEPYRPAARSVFSVPGQNHQVCSRVLWESGFGGGE